MTVDEVLESGEYVDRRGRVWGRIPGAAYWGWKVTQYLFVPNSETWSDEDMRLLIERDKHRDECEGLEYCLGHPVPHVIVARYRPAMFSIHEAGRTSEVVDFRHALPAAVDAARALAVANE